MAHSGISLGMVDLAVYDSIFPTKIRESYGGRITVIFRLHHHAWKCSKLLHQGTATERVQSILLKPCLSQQSQKNLGRWAETFRYWSCLAGLAFWTQPKGSLRPGIGRFRPWHSWKETFVSWLDDIIQRKCAIYLQEVIQKTRVLDNWEDVRKKEE